MGALHRDASAANHKSIPPSGARRLWPKHGRFAWGLERRGHQLTVLCSDAPYLPQPGCDVKLNALIERSLQLKGDFKNGVHHLKDAKIRHKIDIKNHKVLLYQLQRVNFDGVLLGNLDLLGPEILLPLKQTTMPVLHHIGYVTPPFGPGQHPKMNNYHLVAASHAVREALIRHGEQTSNHIPVVYPGARCDLFKKSRSRTLPAPLGLELTSAQKLGDSACPLKICFAGLLMSTKGAHTIAEALVQLKAQKFNVELSIAGGEFQKDYCHAIRSFVRNNDLADKVYWYGQLSSTSAYQILSIAPCCCIPLNHSRSIRNCCRGSNGEWARDH